MKYKNSRLNITSTNRTITSNKLISQLKNHFYINARVTTTKIKPHNTKSFDDQKIIYLFPYK